MNTSPTSELDLAPRAWAADPFWRDVVNTLTRGKKLRFSHYLEALTSEDLDQLRCIMSSTLSVAAQREKCPPRRHGQTAGALPSLDLVSRISMAIRRTQSLRDLQVENLVETARLRCQKLGVDTGLTDQVIQAVAQEVLNQKTQQQLGPQAIATGKLLLQLEAVRSKSQQEQEKIRLREKAEVRQHDKLRLDWEKYRFDAALACREKLPELKLIEANPELTETEKTTAFVEKLFGKKPEWLP